MMLIPLVMFWFLIYFGREELGLKGIIISIVIWLGLFLGNCLAPGIPSYFLTAGNVLLDIVLLLIIFGGDINITLR
jgi:hypothetical protein